MELHLKTWVGKKCKCQFLEEKVLEIGKESTLYFIPLMKHTGQRAFWFILPYGAGHKLHRRADGTYSLFLDETKKYRIFRSYLDQSPTALMEREPVTPAQFKELITEMEPFFQMASDNCYKLPLEDE